MSTANGILEGLRHVYRESGESPAALAVLVAGMSAEATLVARKLRTWDPDTRPAQMLIDANRLQNRLHVLLQTTDRPAWVAGELFTKYTGGTQALAPGELDAPGLTGPYTPSTRPEAWKLGSLLGQMAELEDIEHALNAQSAWAQISGGIMDAAEELGDDIAGLPAVQWLGEVADDAAGIAVAAAKGLATVTVIGLGLLAYLALRDGQE